MSGKREMRHPLPRKEWMGQVNFEPFLVWPGQHGYLTLVKALAETSVCVFCRGELKSSSKPLTVPQLGGESLVSPVRYCNGCRWIWEWPTTSYAIRGWWVAAADFDGAEVSIGKQRAASSNKKGPELGGSPGPEARKG